MNSSDRTTAAVLILTAMFVPLASGRAEAQTLPQYMTPEAARAVERGLTYLQRTQSENGSWRSGGRYGTYPIAMTSLAGLAFLAHGDTPFRGRYANVVKKAVDFMLRLAESRGAFRNDVKELLITVPGAESRSMHGHGFAMLFLAEVYGMCDVPEYQDRIRVVLEKAIKLTARSQSAPGGWLYHPNSSGDEGSVTVTQVQGLRACRNAGIKVPKKTINNAVGYIEKSAQPDGGIAYRATGGGSSRPPISAAAVAVLYNAGRYDSPIASKALDYCVKTVKPEAAAGATMGHYFYAHLYMAQATYTAGGKYWDNYFPKMREVLLKKQNKADGSWMGDYVGTIYGTAIANLILQLPYNTLPIMQR